MGEILDLSKPEDLDYNRSKFSAPSDLLRWLLIQATDCLEFDIGKTPTGRTSRPASVPPERLIAFTILPVNGCEDLHLGLSLYPATVKARIGRHWARASRRWTSCPVS